MGLARTLKLPPVSDCCTMGMLEQGGPEMRKSAVALSFVFTNAVTPLPGIYGP